MTLSSRRSKLISLSSFLVYLLIIILREPRFFTSPRIWAEEGAFHFLHSYSMPWLQALFAPVRGYLNFWPNLSTVLAAHFVPLEKAALVTTLMAFFIQATVGAWIVTTTAEIGNHPFKKIGLLLIVLFIPLTYEMWLNTINSMEVFGVITFLILIEPAQNGTLRKNLSYLLLLIAGLTGLYSLFLTPFFLLKSWLEKSRPRLVQGLILVACALAQGYLILFSKGAGSLGPRFTDIQNFGPGTVIMVFFTQSIGLILTGLDHMRAIVMELTSLRSNPAWYRIVDLAVLIVEIGFMWFFCKKLSRKDRFIYLGSYVLLIFASVFLSIDRDKSVYIQPGYGQRHFFIANIILGIMILFSIDWSSERRWKFRSLFATSLMGLAIIVGVSQFEANVYRYPGWPSWEQQITIWRADPSYKIVIWPDPWLMQLPAQHP